MLHTLVFQQSGVKTIETRSDEGCIGVVRSWLFCPCVLLNNTGSLVLILMKTDQSCVACKLCLKRGKRLSKWTLIIHLYHLPTRKYKIKHKRLRYHSVWI